jgi:PHD/YefM family antitoxin component YafN of YafNO toxin-antitoxin module
MKIVVSVHELSTETQLVIDNMSRSGAPVLIGDPNKPMAVLLSLDEYNRLLRLSQKAASVESAAAASPPPAVEASRKAAAAEVTQPVNQPAAVSQFAGQPAPAPKEPVPAEVVPATQHSDIAQRTAAAIQADRSVTAEPKVVSQRQNTLQPDAGHTAGRAAIRSPRLTKPLPKPPRPLEVRRSRPQFSLAAVPGGWQTIALILGIFTLGVIGLALLVSALSG